MFLLSRDAVYLKSEDHRLVERMKKAEIRWHVPLTGIEDDKHPDTGAGAAYQIRTGLMRTLKGRYLTDWRVVGPLETADWSPVRAGIIDPAHRYRQIKADSVGNVTLVPEGAPNASGVYYAVTTGMHPRAEKLQWHLSLTGAKKVAVWINGREAFAARKPFGGILGQDWLSFTAPVRNGNNFILVRLLAMDSSCRFRLRTEERPMLTFPIDRTNAPGVIVAAPENSKAPNALVDNDAKSRWSAQRGPCWVQFSFVDGRPYPIRGYIIAPPNNPANAPKNWVFKGSNDGQTWTELDRRSNVKFRKHRQRTFKFENSAAFRMYRLDIAANGKRGTQMAEIQLLDF